MRRIGLVTLLLLLGAMWVVAQQSGYPDQSSKSSSGEKTKVEGCLSSSDGGYTLTDKSGTEYQLTGDTAKLSDHVGHEVQITGTTAQSSATSSGMGNEKGQKQQLDVSSMKHISANCTTKAKPESDKPMSEKPPGF